MNNNNYQRLREDSSNQYPGNAPPAYPQIEYNQGRNTSQQAPPYTASAPVAQPVYGNSINSSYQQHLLQGQSQPQPSPYSYPYGNSQPQQQPYGTYTQLPQEQPVYNAYGQSVTHTTVVTNPGALAYQPLQPVVVQPGVPGHLIRGIWSDSIFDCFSHIPSCLLACFLPCIRWAMTLKRANLMSFWGALLLYAIPYLGMIGIQIYFNVLIANGDNVSVNDDYYGYNYYDSSYNGLLIALYSIMVVTNIFVVILSAVFRTKIREKYQIPGSSCEDCCWHFCCSCCAIAQEARHVDRDLGLAV